MDAISQAHFSALIKSFPNRVLLMDGIDCFD